MKQDTLRRIQVNRNTPLREVIQTIDSGGVELAIVVGDGGHLLGTITDGDVRRSILRGSGLEARAGEIMQATPVTSVVGTSRDELQRLMTLHGIKQIPLLDSAGRVVEVSLWSDLLSAQHTRPNAVVILAGGLGKRLRPLTENVPKPLLPVGDKPLLVLMIEQLRGYGFSKIFLSVNYHAEQIRDILGDGSDLAVQIEYLEEERPLGTAGSVRLAADRIHDPVLVMNGDLLTRAHFGRFLDYHLECGHAATVGLKQYEFTVPYGVTDIEGDRVVALREKPLHSFFVNAGLYVLEPDVVDLIPSGVSYNMTDLIERLLGEERSVGGFPVHEYWLDIGEHAQYEQANGDYKQIFPGDPTCG